MKSISELTELIFAHYPALRKMYRDLVSIKDIPLTITQLTALHILSQRSELSMSKLAYELCMSNQQLTKVMDALEDFGMAERVCDPKNRRKFHARLTPKGVELLDSLKAEVDLKMGYALRKTTQEEIDKLYESVEYIMSYLDKVEK